MSASFALCPLPSALCPLPSALCPATSHVAARSLVWFARHLVFLARDCAHCRQADSSALDAAGADRVAGSALIKAIIAKNESITVHFCFTVFSFLQRNKCGTCVFTTHHFVYIHSLHHYHSLHMIRPPPRLWTLPVAVGRARHARTGRRRRRARVDRDAARPGLLGARRIASENARAFISQCFYSCHFILKYLDTIRMRVFSRFLRPLYV